MSRKYAHDNAELLTAAGLSTEGKGRNEKRWAKKNPASYDALVDYLNAQSNASTEEQQVALQNNQFANDLALQQQQQQFDLMSDSTSYQREVADMKAAGLNVGAIGGSSSSGTTSGSLNSATNVKEAPAMPSTKDGGNVNSALIMQSILSVARSHKNEVIQGLYRAADTEVNDARKVVKEAL